MNEALNAKKQHWSSLVVVTPLREFQVGIGIRDLDRIKCELMPGFKPQIHVVIGYVKKKCSEE